MRRQLVLFAAVYVVSFAALWGFGIPTAIPWAFLPYLLTMVLPLAYASERLLSAVEPKLHDGVRGTATAVAMGIVIVGANACIVAWPPVAIGVFLAAAFHLITRSRALLPPLAVSCVALLLLFGSVWNMNYLVGALAYEHRLDDAVHAWDVAAYQAILGKSVERTGMYPLLKSRALFLFIEAAYMMLYVELFVVVMMLAGRRRSPVPFFAVTMFAYLISGVVFYFWPIVGPYIYVETLDAQLLDSKVGMFIEKMSGEYERMAARKASNGFGYVVGLPSLHVAMAVIMQRFLAASRVHFWAFVPINVLLIISTFYLGFHYLIDVAAGFVLAFLVLAIHDLWMDAGFLLLRPHLPIAPPVDVQKTTEISDVNIVQFGPPD